MTELTLPTERTERPEPPAARRRSWLVLPIILTCQLMLVLDLTVMNVALPRIRADLGFSATGLSWVINAYALVFGGLLLLGGRVGDLFGRRRVFIAGIALFTAASLAGGLATSAGWLLAARVVQGLGAAAAGPSALALLTTVFTEARERVRALAIYAGVSSAGFAIGLILGGALTDWASWRSVLFINVPFGAAAALLATRFVPQPRQHRHRVRLDLPGAVTATGGVAALVYAFIRAADAGWGDAITLAALGIGLLLLCGFLAIELGTRQPLMPPRLFADRDRASAYLIFFLGPMAMMSTFFFLTQFLQNVRGFSPLTTGLAFLPLAIAMFAMTQLIPRLLARLGAKPPAVAGAALMIAGVGWLTQLSPTSGYLTAVFGPMLLMGLGVGLGFAPLNVIIMSTVPAEDAGAAGGVLQTVQQVGGALGLAVLVTVFGIGTRHAADTGGGTAQQILVAGMTDAFAASAIFAACALLVALTFRGRPASPGS